MSSYDTTVAPHQQVKNLSGSSSEMTLGKRVHIKRFPKGHQVKLFRIVSDTGRTAYIVTNDLSQLSVKATKTECRVRWKIERLHREIKQITGIGTCQCRKLRAQRNRITCCLQVWGCLKHTARSLGPTIYELKESLLDDYMRHQLSNPSIIVQIA